MIVVSIGQHSHLHHATDMFASHVLGHKATSESMRRWVAVGGWETHRTVVQVRPCHSHPDSTHLEDQLPASLTLLWTVLCTCEAS